MRSPSTRHWPRTPSEIGSIRLGDADEPLLQTAYGYALGIDAPGLTLLGGAFQAAHHQLLAHGRAVAVLRSADPRIGRHRQPPHRRGPAGRSAADRAAARFYDSYHNRQFADPILLRAVSGDHSDNAGCRRRRHPGRRPVAHFRPVGFLWGQLCPSHGDCRSTGKRVDSVLPGGTRRSCAHRRRLAGPPALADRCSGRPAPPVPRVAAGLRHRRRRSVR